MIKSEELLNKTLVDFLKSQLLKIKSEGVVIHLDGTLMSLTNILLARQLGNPFKVSVVITILNQNKYYLTHLLALCNRFDITHEIRDLSKDLDTLSIYKNAEGNYELEVAYKKRLIDLALSVEADKNNLTILSNLCYSQWCTNFPHRNYQNLSHIHLLNRLHYSELKQLAEHLEIPKAIVDREPSHYLLKGQTDKKSLGFTYEELENFLRTRQVKNQTDVTIRDMIKSDNRHLFMNPIIQRPSNLLG